MPRGDEVTLRLLWPQWQGAGTSSAQALAPELIPRQLMHLQQLLAGLPLLRASTWPPDQEWIARHDLVTQDPGLACPAGGLWLPRPGRRAARGREQAMGGNQVSADPPAEGIVVGEDGISRCWWGSGDPLYRRYHDTEWGRPVAEDRRLFEKLSLEGFQAGLSWLTILRKRERFREVFAGFDPAVVARFGAREVDRLLADPGIVRNRAKIEATINNASRYGELAAEFGSLAAYVWRFEPGPQARPPVLDYASLLQLGQSSESKAMSKDLRRRGWSFVGPTTVYAFMEAMGLVNDHLEGCGRRPAVERERHRFRRPSVAAGGTRSGS